MDFSSLWIWKYMKDDLRWYYKVATNRKPAKYLIAKRVGVDYSDDDKLEELWSKFYNALPKFLSLWKDVDEGKEDITKLEIPKVSLLDLMVSIVRKWLYSCSFCRWRCRVNRVEGKKYGACMLDTESRVGAYFHHRGEELVFRGVKGSGTIFFTSCNMRCAFCQNGDISTDKYNGVRVTPRDLAYMMKELRLEGVHNINLVGGEPTIHLHTIIEAIDILAREGFSVYPENYEFESVKYDSFINYPISRESASYKGELNVPILWNSNFYMSDEALNLLRVVVDIWLPDFKYGNDKCALRLSRTPWYVETVTKNLKTVRDWGENMVIRHLIMPNHVYDDTFPVLDWIAKNMPEVWVNIMDQYHPDNFADPNSPKFRGEYKDIARYPTEEEINEAWNYARKLGLKFDVVTFEKRLLL
ncbi:MAG: radical SAM protein [Sulfolobaceae archaeon]|nr:radical SAM protein [Sulfolobaceae archaeon]